MALFYSFSIFSKCGKFLLGQNQTFMTQSETVALNDQVREEKKLEKLVETGDNGQTIYSWSH